MKKNFEKIQDGLEKRDTKKKYKKMIITGKSAFILKDIMNKKTGK